MVIVSLFCAYIAYYYHAPIPFVIFCGGFFLLPAVLIYKLSQDAKNATDAYEAGFQKKAKALWEASQYDDSATWRVWLEIEGQDIKRYAELGRGGDNINDFFDCDQMNNTETDVTVWLHPKTNFPNLMMYQDKIFPLIPSTPKWARK